VIAREDSRVRRQGLLVLDQSGLRHFQQVPAAGVNHAEEDREKAHEESQEEEHDRMRVLTNGRENSAARESEKHHEEVEGLDALFRIKLNMLPDVVVLTCSGALFAWILNVVKDSFRAAEFPWVLPQVLTLLRSGAAQVLTGL
jgi:hypothetical protein